LQPPRIISKHYRRSDLFGRRRRLMDDWAKYCAKSTIGDVVPLRKRGV
jgi:hypothetical protein